MKNVVHQRLRQHTERRSFQSLTCRRRSACSPPAAVFGAAASAPSEPPSDVYPESLANAPSDPPPGATLPETGQREGVNQSGLYLMLGMFSANRELGFVSPVLPG